MLVARSIFILLVIGRCILFLSCMDRERGEAKIGDDPGDYLPEEVADSYIESLFPKEEMAMYERAVKDSLEPTFGRVNQNSIG